MKVTLRDFVSSVILRREPNLTFAIKFVKNSSFELLKEGSYDVYLYLFYMT